MNIETVIRNAGVSPANMRRVSHPFCDFVCQGVAVPRVALEKDPDTADRVWSLVEDERIEMVDEGHRCLFFLT